MNRILIPLLTLFFYITDGNCSEGSTTCPDSLHFNTIYKKLTAPVDGWEAFQYTAPYLLMTVIIYKGLPENGITQPPDTNNIRKCVWLLKDTTIRYWIRCIYAHTTATLVREIPREMNKVEALYEHDASLGGYPSIINVTFK